MPDIDALAVFVAALVLWIRSFQHSIVAFDENAKNAIPQIGVQLSARWNRLTFRVDQS